MSSTTKKAAESKKSEPKQLPTIDIREVAELRTKTRVQRELIERLTGKVVDAQVENRIQQAELASLRQKLAESNAKGPDDET